MAQKPIWVYLIGAARKVWRWYGPRNEVKRNAKHCAICEKKFTETRKIEIDHIQAVGPAPKGFEGWDSYYQRLFCPIENLQATCTVCHKSKTKKDREKMRQEKANG